MKGKVIPGELRDIANEILAIANRLDLDVYPWDRDISDKLYTHPSPYAPGAWWERSFSQIEGLTIHHTLSHSPHATAEHYCKFKGRPTIPYHIWVTQTGVILKCLDFNLGCWHDHTGHKNKNLSVGLAGKLHIYEPTVAQLDAAAHFTSWVLDHPAMNVIKGRVKGHQDHFNTQCPGWNATSSGKWKSDFYGRL